MPNVYDNKLLDGAGLSKFSELIKTAIASGVGADEIYIGTSTPSTSQYKIWINPSGDSDTLVRGITLNGSAIILDANNIANLTNIQSTITFNTAYNSLTNKAATMSDIPYHTTTSDTNLDWNVEVLRSETDTTAISAKQPDTSTFAQTIHGFFLSDGITCDFTVANAIVTDGENSSTLGEALSVEVKDDTLYEFSLHAISDTKVALILKEW